MRQPKFRKMRRDIIKLRKLNTSYRRKARRLKKLYGVELDYNVMYIDDFESRKQFNAYIKQMEHVTDYNTHRYVKNKHGMVVDRPLWQKYKDMIPEINRLQEQHLNKLLTTLEKEYGYKPSITEIRAMGDSKFDRYLPVEYSFDNYTSAEFFKEHVRNLEKKLDPLYHWRRDRQMKQNFIEAIRRSLGAIGEPIIKEIEKMTIEEFSHFFYINDIPLFDYVYSFEEAMNIVSKLQTMINRFKKL